MSVEWCAVFQRLKLLRRLQEVDLSPDEVWALLERVKTNSTSAEDRERTAHLIRVTFEVTEQIRTEPDEPIQAVSEPRSPKPQAKRKRQLTKAARRRHRR
jgi:DNA-binding transcriptional MerR regulator